MHLLRNAGVQGRRQGCRRVCAFKNHLSYLPHSGSVLPTLASELTGYEGTTGSLHFPIDEPLPRDLVDKVLTTRMKQLGLL
jgi:uncharacterized protein YdhG (YjbR/CyaY superfamily)